MRKDPPLFLTDAVQRKAEQYVWHQLGCRSCRKEIRDDDPTALGASFRIFPRGLLLKPSLEYAARQRSSYIQDTTHFLRILKDVKSLPSNSLLVTMDVSALYTNIPHEEGVLACLGVQKERVERRRRFLQNKKTSLKMENSSGRGFKGTKFMLLAKIERSEEDSSRSGKMMITSNSALCMDGITGWGMSGSLHHNGLANLICKVLIDEYIYWTLLKVSTTNLVFITIERYLAVVHPIKYRKTSSKRLAISVCVSAWILGGIVNLYFPLTHEVSDKGECTNDRLERGSPGRYVIAVITLLTTLVFPVGIMLYAYIAIIWKLRPTKSDQPSTDTALESVEVRFQQRPPDKKTGGFRERGRKNVLITLFIVSLTYTICWTPDMVLYFHHNVVARHDWTDPLHQFVILLAVSNVFVNPIIYTLKYKSFQKGLKKVFKTSPDTSWQISSTAPASTTDSKFQ
ncbi:Neuromedin-U receptor 2 [Holothuria leucospilota]|uniref:Neuromedin-U receptor 2 n=1 Tax=Holothuria leucospilota TaxID=206669 RepID=A0A9Q1HH02_HOLLE|nr:Neuromedin-U receptor 2 [Holothuria leucospilota]